MNEFETLIKDNKSEKRWYPTSLEDFEKILKNGALISIDKEIRKNMQYSLQYLQYIDLQLKYLKLSNVILTMLIKTYVIITVSVIESILEFILRKKNLIEKIEWEQEKAAKVTASFGCNKNYKVETIVYKRMTNPVEKSLKLDEMIKIIQKKKLFSINFSQSLKSYQKLRNKVHLSSGITPGKYNWHEFNYKEYQESKYLLFLILSDPMLENIGSECENIIKYFDIEDNKIKNSLK